jgi:5-methylcytosine-specific restriction endonuclease McrA
VVGFAPCVACRQVKNAKQRVGSYGYRDPHFTGSEWLVLVMECGGRCLRCGGPDLTVDHVIPLGERKRDDATGPRLSVATPRHGREG